LNACRNDDLRIIDNLGKRDCKYARKTILCGDLWKNWDLILNVCGTTNPEFVMAYDIDKKNYFGISVDENNVILK